MEVSVKWAIVCLEYFNHSELQIRLLQLCFCCITVRLDFFEAYTDYLGGDLKKISYINQDIANM